MTSYWLNYYSQKDRPPISTAPPTNTIDVSTLIRRDAQLDSIVFTIRRQLGLHAQKLASVKRLVDKVPEETQSRLIADGLRS